MKSGEGESNLDAKALDAAPAAKLSDVAAAASSGALPDDKKKTPPTEADQKLGAEKSKLEKLFKKLEEAKSPEELKGLIASKKVYGKAQGILAAEAEIAAKKTAEGKVDIEAFLKRSQRFSTAQEELAARLAKGPADFSAAAEIAKLREVLAPETAPVAAESAHAVVPPQAQTESPQSQTNPATSGEDLKKASAPSASAEAIVVARVDDKPAGAETSVTIPPAPNVPTTVGDSAKPAEVITVGSASSAAPVETDNAASPSNGDAEKKDGDKDGGKTTKGQTGGPAGGLAELDKALNETTAKSVDAAKLRQAKEAEAAKLLEAKKAEASKLLSEVLVNVGKTDGKFTRTKGKKEEILTKDDVGRGIVALFVKYETPKFQKLPVNARKGIISDEIKGFVDEPDLQMDLFKVCIAKGWVPEGSSFIPTPAKLPQPP
ncbi:MAG: hypothetical protein Q7R93_03785, partial [bacterium]|nr:hypothetical protein [bacterium]